VASALTPYLLSSTASATYQTISGMSAYLSKAGNLAGLTNLATARDNLNLGTLNTPVFAGVQIQGSGSNVANLGATFLTLSQPGYGMFTIQPSQGIVFPDATVQTTAYPGPAGATTWGSITGTLSSQTDLQSALDGKASSARGLPTGGTVGQVLTKNSGSNFDASFATLIPGDRYVTTSTSTLSVSNGTKSLTIGTGLAYTPNQDVTISLTSDPTLHHMHGPVVSYNSGTGALVVDVSNHTGSGTFSSWTVNVGGTVPLETVEWGEVLGTLGDQTDLATALNAKLEITDAASTYQTIAGMSSYLTTSDAATTYYPLSNPDGFITSAALSGYATESWVSSQGYITSSALTGYATESWVTSGFYPLTGNPSGFLTGASLSGYALLSGATFTGLVSTPASTTTTAGLRLPHGTAPTTPTNGDLFTTTSGLFARINGSTRQYVDLDGTQTINGTKTFSGANQTLGNATSAGTINVGTGATVSGSTKAVNIGTAGASGSTTNIAIGSSVAGSGVNVTVNGVLTTTGATQTISNGTGATTTNIGTGATISGSTKAVNIGTNGVAGSTTNIAIGSGFGTSTTVLNGSTVGVTLAADTNTTGLATTAYVVGQAGSATPLVNGTAAVGTSLRYARQDHVHGTDTTRAPLASPTFTGTPLSTTAAADTNTTQIATTAFVVGQGYLKSATASSTYAPLASAALTGVPTAPTATAGTNTTQLATTAFVTAAVPAFATLTEARQFSNTTKVLSPSLAIWSMFSADIVYIQRSNFTVTNVGSVQYANLGTITTETRLASAAASSSRARTFGPSQVDQSQSATVRSSPQSTLNFSLRTFLGGRSATFNITDPVLTMAFYYGKAEGDGVGNLTRRGMGWKVTGGTGSRFLTLEVHNGTILTSVTSSFAVTGGVAFDWDIISDGSGNVTLYVNGASVATSSAGPTGSHNVSPPVVWQEEYSTSGVPAITFHTSYHSRGRLAVINY
jgi:hypothetical protein